MKHAWLRLNVILVLGLLACLPLVYQITYAQSTNHVLILKNGKLTWDQQNTQVINGVASLTLFSRSYLNVLGKEAVLAPGTQGSNTFELINQQGVQAQYQVYAYVENPDKIPVHFDLSQSSEPTSLPQFIKANQLVGYSQGVLAKDESQQLRLEWEWPFEQDDQYDTQLGQANPLSRLKVYLYVTMSYADTLVKAGPNTSVSIWWPFYLFLLFVSGMLCLYQMSRRKQNA